MSHVSAVIALGLSLSVSHAIAQDAVPEAPEAGEVYGPQASQETIFSAAVPQGIPDALTQAISTAYQSSPLIDASKAASEGAQADLRSAKWQRFPNLTAEILTTTGGSDISDRDGIAANVALEQPVWAGGSISSQIKQARASALAADSRVGVTRQTLMLDITQAYYDVALFDGRIAILQRGLAEYGELAEGIERRVSQQVSPAVDLTLARSRTAQLEADLASALEQRDIAHLRLTELVGEDVSMPPADMDSIAQVPPEELAIEEMKACSPTLQERTYEVDAAQSALENAEAQLFPRLLLQLSQNELTGARAALVLRAQTGNGLSKLSNIDSAEAEVARATADLAQADRQMRTLLRRQYASYRAGLRGAEVSSTAANASAELLASYQRQFVAGRRSWLDLSNAVSEVLSAQLSAHQNQNASAASAALILALTCRWQAQG